MAQFYHDFDIFNQAQNQSFSKDDYFFDIECFYRQESTHNFKDEEPQQLQRVLTDQFAEEPHVEPFRPYPLPASPEVDEGQLSSLFRQQLNLEREEPTFFRQELSSPSGNPESQNTRRAQAKSIATKNVCFNICQKTIKVIQKQVYATKLSDICEFYGAEEEAFIDHILKEKKRFTGPKALQMYVESQTVFSKVFRQFMRWFLREKYLRHCLNGDMKDKEAYIKYKNEVILVILD